VPRLFGDYELKENPLNTHNMQNSIWAGRLFACLGLALAICLPADAFAGRWPASVGGAIAAKVIGQRCPGALSPTDIAEIEAYIAKYSSEAIADAEQKAKRSGETPFPFKAFQKSLTEKYEKAYRDPQRCDADARKQAQAALRHVRQAMAGGGALLPADPLPDR
jgi:hypothetical protein